MSAAEGGARPRGFGLGLGLTLGAFVAGFFLMAQDVLSPPIVIGVLLVLLAFVGASMPQLGGSMSRYALGVATGLGIAFLLFALCTLWVLSMFA